MFARRSSGAATYTVILFTIVVVFAFGLSSVDAIARREKGRHSLRPSESRIGVTIPGTPLRIVTTNELATALFLDGKSQFFDDFDSGTFVEVDGRVYGSKPTGSATFFTPVPFAAVSNQGPTGTGRRDDPFKLVTVVDAGETGIRLLQTTSYVNGEQTYSTSFTIQNSAPSPKLVRLFHAADLFLDVPDNIPDFGIGFRDPNSGAIGATTRDGNMFQGFLPSRSTIPDAYQESAVDGKVSFWELIGNENAQPGPGFNNTIASSFHDVAAGLQWSRTVDPGKPVTLRDEIAIGPQQVVIPRPAKPAKVSVVQRTDPNITSMRGDVVTYTIIAKNYGEGDAKNAVITMPFDESKVRLLDVRLSRPEAWVSQVVTNSLDIQTGSLGHDGDVVTATVRLMTLPSIADSSTLGSRLSYRWYDDTGDGSGNSNLITLIAGQQNVSKQTYDLITNASQDDDVVVLHFTGTIFAPSEPVALWYNKPDGTVEGIGSTIADAEGKINVDFRRERLDVGDYSMVAYGLWTNFTALGTFTVK